MEDFAKQRYTPSCILHPQFSKTFMEEQKVSYLDGLNEVQRGAVTTTEGPVLVIAGPGSGKTRVLTYRIAHLIQEGVAPYNILTLTFTNKAAKEMKERISQVVGKRAAYVWAGTFHSIFARILRVEAEKLGYSSNFTIYDSKDTSSILAAIIAEMRLDSKTYDTNGVKARISSAKSNLISPAAYEQNQQLMMQDRKSRRPYLFRIYKQYAMRCKRAGAMDFDDLLYQMFVLLHKNPDGVLEKYRKKFPYVLVDEFQDTNFLQYSIIKKLVNYPKSPRNICVVGDDAQSIYAFRGATIENILNFKRDYPKLQTFKLEQNYRSTNHIVQAANELILHNTGQIQKKIWSFKGEGQKIQLIKAVSDSEEGRRIAGMILEQKTRYHLKNKDVAILYRTNAQSRVFEEFLRRYDILYKVYGGLSFYQRKEIKDVIAYLRLVVNPNDEEALRRVLNYPTRGIGKGTIEMVSQLANEYDTTPWAILEKANTLGFKPKAAKSLLAFVNMIKGFQRRLATDNAFELAEHVAKKSTILAKLDQDTTVQGISRRDNVRELLDGIKDFVDNDELIDEATLPDKSLPNYLQNIALLTDQDSDKENDDRVALMSIHAAKGLEFKSVFVAGMEEQLFPSFMALQEAGGLDEERRLFYVAVTRAEEFLTLSFAGSRYRYGKLNNYQPSRFLSEISEENLEQPIYSKAERQNVLGEQRSGIKGFSKPMPRRSTLGTNTNHEVKNTADYKVCKPGQIEAGLKIEHIRFGAGVIVKLEGAGKNAIVHIDFGHEVKRIVLRFAKLKIV